MAVSSSINSHRRIRALKNNSITRNLLMLNHSPSTPNRTAKNTIARDLSAALDPDNSGVLIVQLEGGTGVDRARERGAPMLGVDDISSRLERRDDGCIIM
jgi:hypothetical protein